MTEKELLLQYSQGKRDFNWANLKEANLYGANLYGANFEKADLTRADLTRAYLYGANLQWANLSGASLYRADLKEANLYGANLYGANLYGANLERAYLKGAYLKGANLTGAYLKGADLEGANLYGANFEGANLINTILDPNNRIPSPSDAELLQAGFEIDETYVYGYRTKYSQHVTDTEYIPGKTYTAPIFSVCQKTSCHPGIYLASKGWLEENYKNVSLVKVQCRKTEILKAGDKFRCKELYVIEDIK